MLDSEKTLNGHRLLDVIRIIAFHGETGRLQMTVGSIRGAFFFKNGRLVDASMGSLTGFQAVNAAVSMGDAHFSFEPSIAPPLSSSITANERTILKQFFDIESLDPECDHRVSAIEPNWDIIPSQVVPLSKVEESDVLKETPAVEAQPEEALVPVLTNEETPWLEDEVKRSSAAAAPVFSGLISSASRHRAALYVVILVTLMLGSALVLIQRTNLLLSGSKQNEPHVPSQIDAPVAKRSEPVVNEKSKASKEIESSVPTRERLSRQSEPVDSVAHNLTGEWKVINTVDRTAYRQFNNLEIGFRLVIDQTGTAFTARGEKVSENGRSLPANSRTPIEVVGSIEGDRVEATFFEDGRVRKTNGRFEWRIQPTGSGLAGTFVTNAAKTSGRSAATRGL